MHHALLVRVTESTRHLGGEAQGGRRVEPMVGSAADQVGERPAVHELLHDAWLALLVDDVVHSHDVRVRAETTHGLCFAAHARQTSLVQPIGLDHSDGDVAIQAAVMRLVDALLGPLAEEALHLVTAGGKGAWQRWRLRLARHRWRTRRRCGAARERCATGPTETLLRRIRVLACGTHTRKRSTTCTAEAIASKILLAT